MFLEERRLGGGWRGVSGDPLVSWDLSSGLDSWPFLLLVPSGTHSPPSGRMEGAPLTFQS